MKAENEIVKHLLYKTFFKAWKLENIDQEKYANYSTLEIQINTRCDLNCSYCYYHKYGDQLYPKEISNDKLILENLDMLLTWLEENQLYPRIEPFSGEIFAQEIGFRTVDKVLDFYIRNNMKNKEQHYIVIPTNFTFIFSEKRTQRVEDLLNKAKKNGIKIYLSASVDGKFVENDNRATKSGRVRDDKYYDDVFEFCSRWGYSFHPMIYSYGIEKWIDNFMWFQEMFEKHNMPYWYIYLLEVRNVEWTKQQIKEFYKFFKYVCNYYYKRSGLTGEDFIKFVGDVKLSNVFSIFYRVGRGTGCSTQSTMQLRLGDLSHSVCHRASYKPHVFWKFVTDGKKIIDIEALNAPLFVSHQTLDEDNFPVCESCFLKYLCNGQCLGSMYEVNSSLFVPIPTVCLLEHWKAAAVLDMTIENDLFKYFYNLTTTEKKESMRIYYDRYWKEKRNGF